MCKLTECITDSMQQRSDSVRAAATPAMRHDIGARGRSVCRPTTLLDVLCRGGRRARAHLWRKPASGSIKSDTRMNWSTELFQDLVQMADSFHSVASGRRWFCIAILRSRKRGIYL